MNGKTINHYGLACAILLGLTSNAGATITGELLGTGAPPSTLGGYTLSPIGNDASAEFSTVTSIGGITFNEGVNHDVIGDGWATWSQGYTGNVYDTADSANATSLTMTLTSPEYAFYFYAESLNFDVFTFTATTQDGTTLTQSIDGDGGAAGFGFYATGPDMITSVTVTSGDTDGFAVGEFGASGAAAPIPEVTTNTIYAAMGLWLLVGIWRRFRSQSAAKVAAACMVLMAGLGFMGTSAKADDVTGTDALGVGTSPVDFGSIDPFATQSGFIFLSVDGLGTTSTSGRIRFLKPAGATVRNAYLLAASTGFTSYHIPSGSVTINGSPVPWQVETASSISSFNYWADVTTILEPTIDAAPPGTNFLTIVEGSQTANIDGEILVVIFDDPNQTAFSTVVLLFGAQKVAGDTFNINLSNPIDLTDPSLVLNMSLGISYGFQTTTTFNQFSIVDVNGKQLTQSAGGQDDGQASNGALITVGGIGDSIANPPPTQTVTNFNTDDELYSLIPFVTNGETAITVFTLNPSSDDNIFFAALTLSGGAVVNEGILLSPINATNLVGASATVLATVQDSNGHPITNRLVNFIIVSGPNAGLTASGVTDSNGKITFTYVGTGGVGVDDIQASMIGSKGLVIKSNDSLEQWVNAVPPNLVKSNTGTSVAVGDTFSYDISFDTFSNFTAAVGLEIVDQLPIEENFVSATSFGATSVVYDPATRTVTWNFGTWPPLTAGPTNVLTVQLNANAAGETNVINLASIISSNLPSMTTRDHNPRCPTCTGVDICSAPSQTITAKANRGYYLLTGASGCYDASQLQFFVTDTASSYIAGPFPSGTIVKIKKSPATGTGPASGIASVTVNVIGNGQVYVVDPNGQVSAPITCLSL